MQNFFITTAAVWLSMWHISFTWHLLSNWLKDKWLVPLLKVARQERKFSSSIFLVVINLNTYREYSNWYGTHY